jgi:spore coat polysaccharide biosynthesis protein SpsF
MPIKISAIIQARTGSTRLPSKVVEDVAGVPMLAHTVARLKQCKRIDSIVLATTDLDRDNVLADFAVAQGIACYRGDEDDVLSRYVLAAAQESCDIAVRVTGDCPLIDPSVVDDVVYALQNNPGTDYASNVLVRSYPRGLDAEAFRVEPLLRLNKMTTAGPDREHVTLGFYTSFAESFKIVTVQDTVDNSDLRLTVDEPRDLELIRAIYAHFGDDTDNTDYRSIVEFLRLHPDIAGLNADVKTWSPMQ